MNTKNIVIKIAFSFVAIFSCCTVSAASKNEKAAIMRNLDIFNSIYKELQVFYVDSIDAEKSINAAIGAKLNDIDPYTEYIPAKDQDSFLSMTSGEYGGIGSYITERNGKVYISEPFENSPAHKAGLRAGDHIVKINNDTTAGWTSSKVSENLKGQAGTSLRIEVKRPYVVDSMLTFDIVREKIQVSAVPYYGVIKDNIGYIYLTSFTETAAKEVRDALIDLKKDPRVKSIILDLRGNGGG